LFECPSTFSVAFVTPIPAMAPTGEGEANPEAECPPEKTSGDPADGSRRQKTKMNPRIVAGRGEAESSEMALNRARRSEKVAD
jgi:hypothetical protein